MWIQKNHTVLISLMLFVGMFFPTSFNGVSSGTLTVISVILCGMFYTYVLLRTGNLKVMGLISVILSTIALLFGTLISKLPNFSWTVALFFIVLCLLFCVDIKQIKVDKSIEKVFSVFNIINIFIGIGIIAQNKFVGDFILNYYSAFFDDLVPWMLRDSKPILTFATHSIAGFYLHIFFFLNIRTYAANKRLRFLAFAMFYIGFGFFLQSNTGYLFFFLSLVVLVYQLYKMKKKRFLMLIAMIVVGIFSLDWFQLRTKATSAIETFKVLQASGQSGFSARYSSDGVLVEIFQYIANNPFRPIGMSYGGDLWLTDSGLLITWIRGSLILFLAVYAAFFFFLRQQMMDKRLSIYLFAVFMLFEFAYPNLTYFRSYYLLPFIIIYLNYLKGGKVENVEKIKRLRFSFK